MHAEDFAWLPVALPASTRHVETRDAELATLLGPAAVAQDGDVEIGSVDSLSGRAAVAIVPFLEQPSTSRGAVRAVARLVRHVRLRRAAASATAALRRFGYGDVRTIEWEPGHRVDPAPETATRAERLPLGLVVVGARASAAPTILEAAVDASGCEPEAVRAMKSGAIVAVAGNAVLRVAAGAPAAWLDRAAVVLAGVGALGDIVPQTTGSGDVGIGRWTTETRLPGHVLELDPVLLRGCVDVLVELHALAAGSAPADAFEQHAALIARRVPEDARRVHDLAIDLDRDLAHIPRGFAHGDFWAGNILSAHGRVTGVVDWEGGGAGRLPVLDLMHLLSAPAGPRTVTPEPARAFEWAWRNGGDSDAISDYCQRIGIDGDRALLRRLAVAFWLERAAWMIERSVDETDHAWLRRNVEGVLRFLANNEEKE